MHPSQTGLIRRTARASVPGSGDLLIGMRTDSHNPAKNAGRSTETTGRRAWLNSAGAPGVAHMDYLSLAVYAAGAAELTQLPASGPLKGIASCSR